MSSNLQSETQHQPPSGPNRSPVRRFFSSLGGAITWSRRVFFNALFVIFILLILGSLLPKPVKPIDASTALRIAPSGVLVDQLSYQDPLQTLMRKNDARAMETRVKDLVDAINAAANDERITALVLELDFMANGGLTKLTEIGQALEYFKAKGKPIYAMGDYYSQSQFYLASYADEIYLNPMGGVFLTGFASYRNYFKSALEQLQVKMNVFKVGTYKDFVEPYLRDSMSPASKQQNGKWLNQLWDFYTQQVEARRELPSGSINDFINNMDTQLETTHGDSASLALNNGLVTKLLPRAEQQQELIKLLGEDKTGEVYQAVDYWHYLDNIRQQEEATEGKIGLIVASGTILDGEQAEGNIGGDSLAALIHQATKQDFEALVLRVDSGGGSAFASEIIRQQLLQAEKKFPIYISMGSVAASGGYWIAANSHQIWANPTTITGSIGVFGAFPTVEKSLAKLGVYTDGLATTQLAGTLRIDRTLPPMAESIFQQGVEHTYQRFLDIVAEGRNSTPEAIDKVAQGRVWSGQEALSLGLVDQLGSLNDTIAAAAKAAKLETFSVIEVKRQLSPGEAFVQELSHNLQASLGEIEMLSPLSSQLQKWLAPATEVLHELDSLNDPKGMYARCLSCEF